MTDQASERGATRAGERERGRYLTGKRVAQIVAFFLAIAAAIAVVVLPGWIEVSQSDDGQQTITASTLLDAVGPQILLWLVIPVTLTGIALLVRSARVQLVLIVTTILLGVFCVVASASIGWFFLPAFVAQVVSLFLPPRRIEWQPQT